jgi:hypothetical protein
MWFGRPPGPQWLRPFLAALAGYVVFPTVWLPLARLFEPELADDHGSQVLNLVSDLVTGLGFALTGVMFIFGLAFIGLGTLWGRVQLALLRRFKVDIWVVSAMTGVLAGWVLSLGFSWLLADLSGQPRDQIGAMIAGAVAGAVAGSLLVVQPPSPKRRKSP